MKFSIVNYVFVLTAMTVTGMLPELQCDQDQLVCPLQNITCQCVGTGMGQSTTSWTLDSILIAQFSQDGETLFSNVSYPATAKMLENGLSSNISVLAELKSDPVTLECLIVGETIASNTWSYSIFEPPGPPVIDVAMALNNSSANISWTPPPYNCSFTYILEIANGNIVSVSLSNSSIILTTLVVGESYNFRVASVDAAKRMSDWSQPVSLAMQVPAPVEFVTATINQLSQMNYSSVTAVWKVNQSSLSPSIPPVLHYTVYHNVTNDGDQGMMVYHTNVTIHVPNDQFGPNVIYSIQVAAVNAIGQGPVKKTILYTSTAGEETTSSFLTTSSEPNIVSTLLDSSKAVSTGYQPGMNPVSTALTASFISTKTLSSSVLQCQYSVAVSLSVCVSGIVFSAVAASLASVIVCLIMKKRQGKQDTMKITPTHATPLYDTITKTSGKENIELSGNIAYERVNL